MFELECGDTWIHGAATDPWKTGMLCELLRLEEEWRGRASDLDENADYQSFMENLLLVSEHTCGLDCKKFLYDFKNWDKADFVEARAEDVIGEEAMRPAGTLIHDYLINEELPCYTGGRLLGSYRASERSWEEQRDYIRRAVACLRLREKNGHPVEYTVLGTLRYATYSAKTAEDCYLTYNTNFETTRKWAEPDFAKPGLQYAKTARDQEYAFTVQAVRQQDDQFAPDLTADPTAAGICTMWTTGTAISGTACTSCSGITAGIPISRYIMSRMQLLTLH